MVIEVHLLPDLFPDILNGRETCEWFLYQVGHGLQREKILYNFGRIPTYHLPSQQTKDDLFQDSP